MASVSGATSGLGNTALRGFGGFASGIDRDSLIDQMTMGTTNKITNQQKDITKLGWKAEAFQKVSNMILDMQDKYFSYSSSTSLMNANFFAKNIISTIGDSNFTKFVSASGTSNLMDKLAILGVKQLAKAATTTSKSKASSDTVDLSGLTGDKLAGTVDISKLEGTRLEFTLPGANDVDSARVSFTFPSSFKTEDENGKEITVNIDYTDKSPENMKKLFGDPNAAEGTLEREGYLNRALKESDIKVKQGDKDVLISDIVEFGLNNGKVTINKKPGQESVPLQLNTASSAMKALGFTGVKDDEGNDKTRVDIGDEFNNAVTEDFTTASIESTPTLEYLKGKKLTVNYGGQTKEIEILTEKDWEDISKLPESERGNELAKRLNTRLEKAFGKDTAAGTGNVAVSFDADKGLQFKVNSTLDNPPTLNISANSSELGKVLGIQSGASNKINMNGSLYENREMLGIKAEDTNNDGVVSKAEFEAHLEKNPFTINGTKIEDITADTTMNDVLYKINSNKEAGVTASYLSATNQFVLVANETGKRGEIELGGAAKDIFGDGTSVDGENAKITAEINGVPTELESMTNTFDIEGMKVTVSGTFGYDKDGNYAGDRSTAVSFSAKADTEKVTETVKQFIEDYNALIKEINTQITTKPSKSYGPLTDAQKDEMDETSIENWEKKAKEGLLFNDPTMRQLSMDMQSIASRILGAGVSVEDLEEMGISFSTDYKDGGTLVFDETKFKQAMDTDSEKISNIFTGGGDVKQGLASLINNTTTTYATRYSYTNGGSYGRLIEEAGSEKIPTSLTNNLIYKELQEMEENLVTLRARLKTEQDRYISQFAAMENMISQMNAQSSYLSQLSM